MKRLWMLAVVCIAVCIVACERRPLCDAPTACDSESGCSGVPNNEPCCLFRGNDMITGTCLAGVCVAPICEDGAT